MEALETRKAGIPTTSSSNRKHAELMTQRREKLTEMKAQEVAEKVIEEAVAEKLVKKGIQKQAAKQVAKETVNEVVDQLVRKQVKTIMQEELEHGKRIKKIPRRLLD